MFDAQSWIENTFFSLEHKYDPVKAREYYLKNRELKGRKKAAPDLPPRRDSYGNLHPDYQKGPPKADNPIAEAKAPPVKTESNAAALREAAGKRQAQLRARLERLEGILAQLTEQAKKAAGVEPTSSSDSKTPEKTDSAKKEKEKPKTAAEKKEAAKKAKEDYEKNKTSETNDSAQSLQNKIEEVQKQIADARETIRQAIEKAKKMKPPPKEPTKTPPKDSGKATGRPIASSLEVPSKRGQR